MKIITLYSKFNVQISDKDWDFMCKNRWNSDNPALEIVEAEFGICGARDAKSDDEVSEIVRKTVNELRVLAGQGVDAENQKTTEYGIDSVAHMDEQGRISIEKA